MTRPTRRIAALCAAVTFAALPACAQTGDAMALQAGEDAGAPNLDGLLADVTAALSTEPALPVAETVTSSAIDAAVYDGGLLPGDRSAVTAKVQIMLDRVGISPGVIDGIRGGMSSSAIAAFERRAGLPEDGELDLTVWQALGGDADVAVMGTHVVTAEDLAQVTGPVPSDYADKALEDYLGYATAAEALAEQFHMDEGFLQLLNPDSGFAVGDTIAVVAPQTNLTGAAATVVIDKRTRRLIAQDEYGAVLANYPVAVGSTETPSPEGTWTVNVVAREPEYTYNPAINFQQGDNTDILTIPPGPNGPVGRVWIDLSRDSYGIHGTPEPASLFSAQSHGCVRMTNWDAMELADMVGPGTVVTFLE